MVLFGSFCDISINISCAQYTGISPTVVLLLILKNRALFHICPDCKKHKEQNEKIATFNDEVKLLKTNQTCMVGVENRIKAVVVELKILISRIIWLIEGNPWKTIMNLLKTILNVNYKIDNLETTLSITSYQILHNLLSPLSIEVINLSDKRWQ